jgi:tRNA A-37 threonylcarbamoyl transferase component Bud32
MPSQQPRLPARYELPELIARGGMAEVYRATDTALARTVAVKVLAQPFAGDLELRARFAREAQTAAQLSGEPHVVTTYDVGEEGGVPYIVMEYIPGGSLADRVRGGPIPPARALEWIGQVAGALDRAHARGIVHRDVKPANLLLGADGDVRVTDFGIARATWNHTLTGVGTVLGTSGYMSPEQAAGQRATAASDRYALGCVAFELLTGRRPYAAESVTAEAAAHATGRIPSASDAGEDLPRALDGVFERALAKAPAERYATCADLAAALRGAFRESATETRRRTVPLPVTPGGETATTRYRRSASRPRWAVAAATVALATAGVAVAWVGSGAGDGSPETVVQTEVRTETVTGGTETVTVAEPSTGSSEPEQGGAALNDEGFALMRARDYEAALPLLERAVDALGGSGDIAEAWASYNLALTRMALGSCDAVVDLLDRSQALQGRRKEIDRLRRQAEKRCAEDDSGRHGGNSGRNGDD